MGFQKPYAPSYFSKLMLRGFFIFNKTLKNPSKIKSKNLSLSRFKKKQSLKQILVIEFGKNLN